MKFRWKNIGEGMVGLWMLAVGNFLQAQIRGRVLDAANDRGLPNVTVTLEPGNLDTETDEKGNFTFEGVPKGTLKVTAICNHNRFKPVSQVVEGTGAPLILDFAIADVSYKLATQTITDRAAGAAYLRSIEGMALYAAKKTELIHPDSVLANAAANNARRLFVRVPGLNIWESDGGGLQLGIGGRGLSPNRTSNFNVRQNGYDIAADALGYPESYYTPPAEALQRIEVVRGAASLQYGTQFGGMVNFLFKNGVEDRPFAFTTRNTVGSFGFWNTFNSVGGTLARGNLNYYAFGQYKKGNGWRENSGFGQATGYASVNASLSARIRLGTDVTHMSYLAQQPGGLTDAMFELDPAQSIRDRNWFRVDWNLLSLTADVDLSAQTRLNIRNFGLYGSREALGFLGSINRIDPLEERDLLRGKFNNWGNETRLLHRYDIKGMPQAFLAGIRLYRGKTEMQQGFASADSLASFEFLNSEDPGQSEFSFPSTNLAFFVEHLFQVGERISISPGIRGEYISTGIDGSYYQRAFDFAGNLLFEEQLTDQRDLERILALGGLGISYRSDSMGEFYVNFSQNYRAVTFTDLRVVNPNFRVDSLLQDERGFNFDLGWRGEVLPWLAVDASFFLLRYQDRIGNVLRVDSTDFNYYRFRTNIADATNMGFEWYAEARLAQALFGSEKTQFNLFTNFSFIRARYTDSKEPAFDGNQVELVPPINLKAGVNFRRGSWKGNVQYSYTASHFSDATNAETSPTSVEGRIPSYQVMDASLGWRWPLREHLVLTAELGAQNLLNETYFTRRATGYPGPGIIPSSPRNFYVSAQIDF